MGSIMDYNDIQQELKKIEQEINDIKTASTFCGNVESYQYEHRNSAKKIRIFYDSPTQNPITTLTPTDTDIMAILGKYDNISNSQVAYFTQNHSILLIASTQPILRVENIT